MIDIHCLRMLTSASDMIDAHVHLDVVACSNLIDRYVDLNILLSRLNLSAFCNRFNIAHKWIFAIRGHPPLLYRSGKLFPEDIKRVFFVHSCITLRWTLDMNSRCRRFSPHIPLMSISSRRDPIHMSRISCRRDPLKTFLVSTMVKLLDCIISCWLWRLISIVGFRILARVIAFLTAEKVPNREKVASPYH